MTTPAAGTSNRNPSFPSPVTPFLRIPPDVRRCVFQFLRMEDLLRLACTCKQLEAACDDDSVWKALFIRKHEIEVMKMISALETEWRIEEQKRLPKPRSSFWRAMCLEVPSGDDPYVPSSHPFRRVAPKDAFLAVRAIMQENLKRAKKKNLNAASCTIPIAVLGERGAGKSALVVQFVMPGVFVERYDPTIEDTYRKLVNYGGADDQNILMEVVDCATIPEEILSPAARNPFWSTLAGAIVLFAIDSRDSFRQAEQWIEVAKRVIRMNSSVDKSVSEPACLPIVLAGSKRDLVPQRRVSYIEGIALARKHNILYMENSAKRNENVAKTFETLIQLLGVVKFVASKEKSSTGDACSTM